jgi:Domain of unknown function (DUF4055)
MADVSYESEAYRKQLPSWQLVDDVYVGDRSWLDDSGAAIKTTAKTRRYLPQEPGETEAQYCLRATRSHFSDRFSQAVKDFVGVIFNNGASLEGVPPEILKHWANLDGNGMGGDRLCALVGLQVLRRGHSFLMIDFPTLNESVVSLADMDASSRHPIWVPIAPQQIINWRYKRVGNRQQLTMVVIRSSAVVPDADGFGETKKTFYTVFTPGLFECYEPIKGSDGKTVYRLDTRRSGVMGRRVRGQMVPFDYIPLVCLYGGDRTGFFESNPTLLSLAKLNITHYQVKSDHRQKMHYCSFPTPIRIGGDGSDLMIGPRTVIDVPLGGGFTWSEPNSNSLGMSRQEILDIEEEMNFLGTNYLAKPSDRQAAMTSVIQASKIESQLYLFASDLAQGITEALAYHAAYLGLPYGGRVALDTKFFRDLASDPQLLQVLLQLRANEDVTRGEIRGYMTRKKILELNNESQ